MLNIETIRVWTLQPIEVWNALLLHGELHCDITRSSFFDMKSPYMLLAYDWMRGQMQRRVDGCQGGYPWWAWAERKPDLRRETWGYKQGDMAVRIELEVPRSQVVLSCFHAWDAVLWGSYCGFDAEDEAKFERHWQAVALRFAIEEDVMYGLLVDAGAQLENTKCQAGISSEAWEQIDVLRARIRQSWERIFDLQWMRQSWVKMSPVQATFEVLRREHVVSHTAFQGRWQSRFPSGAKSNE